MKAVILAGRLGTRISETKNIISKPVIEIVERSIFWQILKKYSNLGINDYIYC